MISDILSGAVAEIRKDLKDDPAYGDHEFRDEIESLLGVMDALRLRLDSSSAQS